MTEVEQAEFRRRSNILVEALLKQFVGQGMPPGMALELVKAVVGVYKGVFAAAAESDEKMEELIAKYGRMVKLVKVKVVEIPVGNPEMN